MTGACPAGGSHCVELVDVQHSGEETTVVARCEQCGCMLTGHVEFRREDAWVESESSPVSDYDDGE